MALTEEVIMLRQQLEQSERARTGAEQRADFTHRESQDILRNIVLLLGGTELEAQTSTNYFRRLHLGRYTSQS